MDKICVYTSTCLYRSFKGHGGHILQCLKKIEINKNDRQPGQLVEHFKAKISQTVFGDI